MELIDWIPHGKPGTGTAAFFTSSQTIAACGAAPHEAVERKVQQPLVKRFGKNWCVCLICAELRNSSLPGRIDSLGKTGGGFKTEGSAVLCGPPVGQTSVQSCLLAPLVVSVWCHGKQHRSKLLLAGLCLNCPGAKGVCSSPKISMGSLPGPTFGRLQTSSSAAPSQLGCL